MSADLQLRGVDKVYGGTVHAVRGFDMDVARGEIVALLGSSGCGKTSTLRMIAGFEAVTRGTIALGGRAIHPLPPVRRNVAMAFEGYSLYPTVSVRDNIAFALKAARLPAAEVSRRVEEVSDMLEIGDILPRSPLSLSGGQAQRASLARALVRDADLHLLDEPMGQLEPQLRTLLRGRIKHWIKSRGLTAILVTHDQTEANALADRIAVMEGGVMQQYATPAALKERPANLFTATFIGEPPMNVFPARLRRADGAVTFGLAEGISLSYPDAAFPATLAPGDVVIGARPYAVHRDAAGAPARVTANQWLGDQSHIAADFAGGTVVLVEHDRAALAPGDAIAVAIRPGDLHVFDAASGRALCHGGRPA